MEPHSTKLATCLAIAVRTRPHSMPRSTSPHLALSPFRGREVLNEQPKRGSRRLLDAAARLGFQAEKTRPLRAKLRRIAGKARRETDHDSVRTRMGDAASTSSTGGVGCPSEQCSCFCAVLERNLRSNRG